MSSQPVATPERAAGPPSPGTDSQPGRRALRLRLLAYGLVVAVLAIGALSIAGSRQWELLNTRVEGLRSSLAVLEEGGPPLLAHRDAPGTLGYGNRRWEPVGVSDDQGIYVYAPLMADVLGIDDPVNAVKVIFLALFALPLIAYPLIFYELFGSLLAALVAPLLLVPGIRLLEFQDIYWVPAWAVVTLLPLVLLIDRRARSPRATVGWLAAVMVGASFASTIRSQAGLAVLLAGLLVLLARPWSWRGRAAAAVALIVVYAGVGGLAMAGVREYRDHWVGDSHFAAGAPTSHPFWHTAYIGLGYIPNRYGIRYYDQVAADTVKQINPRARYLSDLYDRILRRLSWNVVKDDPGFVVSGVAQKALVTVGHTWRALGIVALLVPWALLATGIAGRRIRRYLLLTAPALVLTAIPPILSVPLKPYELSFVGVLGFIAILLVAWLLSVMEGAARDRAGGALRFRSLLEAVRRGLPRLTAPYRKAALTAGGAFALVVVLMVLSHPVENRADAWRAQGPTGPAAK